MRLATLALLLHVPFSLWVAAAPTLQGRPSVSFEQYVHREYRTQDGLPSNWIQALLQTRDGHVWVGTHNGLARFDGLRFDVSNTRNTPELPGNDVRALAETGDGALWIGTTAGLVLRRPGCPATFETVDGEMPSGVRAIVEARDGSIWVGGREGVWVDAGGGFRHVAGSPRHVLTLAEDGGGQLWVGSTTGLFAFDGEHFERAAAAQLPDRLDPRNQNQASGARHLLVDGEVIWVATNRGLLEGRAGGRDFEWSGPERTRFHNLLRSRSGSLYVGGRNGLWRTDGRRFVALSAGENVECLLEDREGGLWVGRGANGGLHRYHAPRLEALMTGRLIHCVQEDANGQVWVGSDLGLHGPGPDFQVDYGLDGGLPGLPVKTIARGLDGSLWIGTSRGIARLAEGELTAITDPPELSEMRIKILHQDRSGVLWIAHRGPGVSYLADGAVHEVEDLREHQVRWIHEDDRGRLWLGCDGSIRRCDVSDVGGQLSFERLPINSWCHHVDERGDLWLGLMEGLGRLRDDVLEVVTVRDGLSSGYVQSIGEDGGGDLWLAGRHGLSHVPLSELESFLAGRLGQVDCRSVEQDFDMASLAGTHGAPHALRSSEGTLWMTAGKGVVLIPPILPAPSTLPLQVHLDRLTIDGATLDGAESIAFTSGPRRVGLHFSAPSFTEPATVRAFYRLDGHGEDWVAAGTERVAYYTDLAPGTYTFRLVAENGDGLRSDESTPFTFRVRPRWWERVWVKALGVLGVLLVVALAFHRRTANVRAHNAELQSEIDERKRAEDTARVHWKELARVSRAVSLGELTTSIAHEVKQPLFAIVSNAQSATRLLERAHQDPTEIRAALDDIASDGKRASDIIDHIRALVRKGHGALEALDLNDVVRTAVRLVSPEAQRTGQSIRSELEPSLPSVKGDPVELQQVVINLMLNGLQATEEQASGNAELSVRTWREDGAVLLSVEDHGVGIEPERLESMFEPFYTTKPQGIGMGLAMNRAIIERHGGKIMVDSTPGVGSKFWFRLSTGEVPRS